MCLSETHTHLWAPPAVRDADDAQTFTATLDAMASRPSWTLRGVFKQAPGRPGLPRRFHTKINLNEYWGALEKVVKVEVSFPTRPPSNPVQDNEVNDNLANERTEQRMEVDEEELPEGDEKRMDVVKVLAAEQVLSPSPVAPARRHQRVRRSLLGSPRPLGLGHSPDPVCEPACRTASGTACSPAPTQSPRRRTPLGTINGMESRQHLKKTLSPLSAFADNLARRLARQY